MRQLFFALAVMFALIFAPSPSPGQAATGTTTRGCLNGEWTGTLVLDNSSPQLSFVFQLSDSAFAGMVSADGSRVGEMDGGTLSANTVHFKVDRYEFTGTVKGASMKIDMVMWNGTTRTFTVTKTRAVQRDTSALHRNSC
jgi:hypothetical protein